jgi:hypothetical protein
MNSLKNYYYLTHLSDRELHNLLVKRGVPKPDAQRVRREVAALKAELRSEKARKRMVDGLWGSVLTPLANEQRSVRSMLRYESAKYPNPLRRETLETYAKVLDKVRLQIREYRYYKQRTPKQQAEYMQEELGKTIPNNGEHWTDWVPEKVKKVLNEAFLEIKETAAPHARIKAPFPRTMTKADNHKLRYTHIGTAKKELLEAQQELTMVRELNRGDASEAERDAQARVKHVQNILNWLICADDTEVIPKTWGQLNAADLPTVYLNTEDPPELEDM